jgi:predicted alpha/beta superfamily hydrolase
MISTNRKSIAAKVANFCYVISLASTITACGGSSSTGNAAPEAMNLAIIDMDGGHALPGDILQADYVYFDADGDTEADSQITWLRDGQPIDGEDGERYTLSDLDDGQLISTEVIPVASAGETLGVPALSTSLPVGYRTGQVLPREGFQSTFTGWTYTIEVYLPGAYEETDKNYPVMYQLDDLAQKVAVLDEKASKVILVSIIVEGARRSDDYLLPGAYDYYDFLTLELIPYIESRYRIDSDQRTLMGHSFGGSFAAAGLFFDRPDNAYLSSYVISDGTFSDQADQIIALEAQLDARTDSLPVTLIIGTGTSGNLIGNKGLNQLIIDHEYQDLDRHYFVFVAKHEEVFNYTFRRAVDILHP